MSVTIKFDFKKYYNYAKSFISRINIVHLFLVVLALHFFIISTPNDGFVFDEAHYIPSAIDTSHFIAANAEHTPLSKLVIGWSISVFGNWWFGWRITPVIFSSLSIIIVYMIACFFMDKKYALLASAFAVFDVLFFINGSIAILDPQALFFALIGVLFLLRKRHSYSAIAFGVAVLSKEIAVTVLVGMTVYLLLTKIKGFKLQKPRFESFKPLITFAIIFGVLLTGGIYAYDVVYKPASSVVLISGVTANVIMDQNGSTITTSYSTSNSTSAIAITNPIQHLIFAFNYYSGLTPTINPDAKDFRPPWSWDLPLVNAWNPPLYYGVTASVGDVSTTLVGYYSQINYPVTIFLVPALIYGCYFVWKKKQDVFPLFLVGWLVGTYVPWLLFGLFVQKMTFNYYFLYTTPICSITVVWLFSKLPIKEIWKNRLLFGLLLITIAYFLYYFPLNVFRA